MNGVQKQTVLFMMWLITSVVMLEIGYLEGWRRTGMESGAMKKDAVEQVELRPSRYVWMKVTAYCPCRKCCGEWADGVTANGHEIKPGDRFVAADGTYAFGTMVEVPGYGRVPVLDRGGAIKGNRLDVFFPTHQEALEWGVKELVVKIEQ